QREAAGLKIEKICADDVGGHQVGRELDTAEFVVEAFCKTLRQQSLRSARRSLQQDVSSREERDEHQIERVGMAYDRFSHLRANPLAQTFAIIGVHESSPPPKGKSCVQLAAPRMACEPLPLL